MDSDDVYSDENTLTTMVRAFYEQNCAMVVGTYMMTDFNMNMIAPGIIEPQRMDTRKRTQQCTPHQWFGGSSCFLYTGAA